VGRNDVVGAGRGRVRAARPRPHLLVAADDVLDQITNRPLRTWRRGAELIGADLRKDPGERILSALVSN
jgi:hypothetical protein